MTPEDYVSYPIALALKKAGFDRPCYFFYTRMDAPDDHMWSTTSEEAPIDYNRSVYAGCSMPTLAQAQKWLREKKGYVISIHPESKFFEKTYQHTGWNYSIILISKTGIMSSGPIGNILVEKYEQALSAGIAAALELIEEKGE